MQRGYTFIWRIEKEILNEIKESEQKHGIDIPFFIVDASLSEESSSKKTKDNFII